MAYPATPDPVAYVHSGQLCNASLMPKEITGALGTANSRRKLTARGGDGKRTEGMSDG